METPDAPTSNLKPAILPQGALLRSTGSDLLAQAQNLKPGWQTTEFYFHVAVVIAIITLISFGRADGDLGVFLLTADAALYQSIRKGLKLDSITEFLQHVREFPNVPAQLVPIVNELAPLAQAVTQVAPVAEAIARQELRTPSAAHDPGNGSAAETIPQ